MLHDKDLKDCLLRIGNPTIIHSVFEIIHQLLLELAEPVDSPRFSFKARTNNTYRPLNFSINDLVILSLFKHNGDVLCDLLINESDEPTFAKTFSIISTQRGDGNSKAYWIRVKAEEVIHHLNGDEYAIWKDKCRAQLNKATASPYHNRRTEELHQMVSDPAFREQVLHDLFPTATINKPQMTFFQQDDLQFFHEVLATDSRYRKDDKDSVKRGERIKETIFAKTNFWASEVAKQISELDWQPDNQWNISGNIKKYSWARFWLKRYPESKIYFTAGVNGEYKRLVLKVDFQRKGVDKLDADSLNKADEILNRHDIQQLHIPYEEINTLNWEILVQRTTAYMKQAMPHFLEISNLIHGKKGGGTKGDGRNGEEVMKFPLNTILYGPPGTGKTYSTIDLAVKIIAPEKYVKDDHTSNKETYDSLVKSGNIVFSTFHQSMSYEDFIEGIKPETLDSGAISYTVKDGIFKKLCNTALTPNQEDFDAAYEKLKQDLSTRDNELLDLQTPTGKSFSISLNSNDNLSLYTGLKKEQQGTLTKENIQKQINGEEKYVGWEGYFKGVINHLKSKYHYSEDNRSKEQRYVIIIDEINRGNVSQIFGELITLIEEDKRLGNPDALEITLPYSQHKFGVPSNVYIIGTMNTADRSVEALDTALRRRFSFIEVRPTPELLDPKQMLCSFWNNSEHIDLNDEEWMQEPYRTKADNFYKLIGFSRAKESDVYKKSYHTDRKLWVLEDLAELDIEDSSGIDIRMLLNIINERLEKLLTKDHQIGHAFFINVFSEENLYNAFYQKLIPQLQEYFYGDFGKIGLVLGNAFVKLKEEKRKVGFAPFPYDDVQMLQEKKVYRIHDYKEDGQTDLDAFVAAVKQVYQ